MTAKTNGVSGVIASGGVEDSSRKIYIEIKILQHILDTAHVLFRLYCTPKLHLLETY